MTERPIFGAVLCAGFGTRLRPITDRLPKPLIPFLNAPLVTYALDHLRVAGARRVGVNLHHLADTIPPVVDRVAETMGLDVRYAREWEVLGTAGGVRGIWRALGEPDGTLVVLNGDSVMNVDLAEQVRLHRESGAAASIVVRPRARSQPGRVWLDEGGQLMGLRDMRHPEAGESLREYDFLGVHLLEPSWLAKIPLERGCMVGDVYGPELMAGGRIRAAVHDDFWAALDNPGLFVSTTRRVLSEPGLFAQAPWPEGDTPGRFVSGAAKVHEDARLEDDYFIGSDAVVHAGARLGPGVVVDGSVVTSSANVKNAVIYAMGAVEGEWSDCVAVAGAVAHVRDTGS